MGVRKTLVRSLIIGVIGYEAFQYYNIHRGLSISVKNFDLSLAGLKGLKVKFNLIVVNNSTANLPVVGLNGYISYQNHPLVNFQAMKKILIPGGQTRTIQMEAYLSTFQGLSSLLAALDKGGTTMKVGFSLIASPIFLGFLPVPMNISYSQNIDFKSYIEKIRSVWKSIKANLQEQKINGIQDMNKYVRTREQLPL